MANRKEPPYNGHFGCTCYHPLFVFNQFGDLERCALRPGNMHSADGWRAVLEPVVDRYRDRNLRRYFSVDAGFASLELYKFLEAYGFLYAIRLPANRVLRNLSRTCSRDRLAVRLIMYGTNSPASATGRRAETRPAVSWPKIAWHPDELLPRVGFIVTNLSRPA